MMPANEIRRTADALTARLAAVDHGTQPATSEQRAFLEGAEQALRGVLGGGEPRR